ncbi:hypothetical protein [uncultured Victivallis sp.]|uniref:NAD(P)H-dependent amine dehydrogenase family protein n=1 Tax=uncultured Victivallis sp. TaxID=354118 RepID=UPI0025CFD309|nr:hypothetical protein [uncultured Victivallis sp.]
MKKTRILLCGFGQIGRMLYRTLLRRPEFELAGVIDLAPELTGADAGTVAGCPPCGIAVSTSPEGIAADVAAVTTVSRADACADTLVELVRAGLPAVTTCEELFYPWPLHEAAAMKIDQAARSAGVPVLPVGINPGFLMDYRAAVLSGLTGEITHVHIQRIQDASPRRPAFQKKIGAGLTPAEFEAEKLAGRLRHVGLPESVYFLGTALGRKLDAVTETIEPVIAEEDLAIPGAVPVRQGCARGVRQLGLGICDGREFIRMEFVAAIGEPGSIDRVHLCGTPELDSVIRGGVNGDLGTCAIVLNAARAIAAESRSGLLTMLDMPPVTGA